ncbi:S9 family peptidase, partial [Lysobacter sp. 2RAB21]
MTPRHALLPLALTLACASAPAFALTPALARGLEARDLASLDRYSSPTLSPDGRQLVFTKRVVDFGANKSSTSLWIEDLFARDAAPPKRLTPEGWNVNSPTFSTDGKTVYFLSSKGGSSQLYALPLSGGTPRQITAFDGDVGGYQLSPDGKRLAFNAETYVECAADLACTKKKFDAAEKSKASGKVFDRMFVRHWDAWNDGRLNRLFVTDLPAAGKTVSSARLVSGEVIGDVPSRPFGDSSEYTWSPDSQSLVFSARKADAKEPWSTNFDLYLVGADGGAAKNLTAANPAWDTGAVFSKDGKTLYYRAMKRPGFEADRFGLIELDLASGKSREIAPQWDRSASGIVLSDDGKTIYTTTEDLGQQPLFGVEIASGKASLLIGDGTVGSVALAGKTLAFTRNSLK